MGSSSPENPHTHVGWDGNVDFRASNVKNGVREDAQREAERTPL
jgi:hypothetical protein